MKYLYITMEAISRQNPRADPESQHFAVLHVDAANLLSAVFNIDDTVADAWPGARMYMRYLQQQIHAFQTTTWSVLLSGMKADSDRIPDLIDLIVTITRIVKEHDAERLSIEEVLQLLTKEYSLKWTSTQQVNCYKQAIFSVISWTSALLKPSLKGREDNFNVSWPLNCPLWKTSQPLQTASRPISNLLRAFGPLLPHVEAKNSNSSAQCSESSLLHVSTVNYSSLKLMGKVNIKWVDVISAHLDFKPVSRTLMLFRFPIFCALNCLDGESVLEDSDHVFDRILREYYTAPTNTPAIISALKREILLSYRLIYGQTCRSRKLYRMAAKKRLAESIHDPLLDTLCGVSSSKLPPLPNELWPNSCRDDRGRLQEQEVYSVEVDFPVLGPKLQKLQAFNMRQRPSTIRDMWRDRRNPLQWYTFWMMLVFGGVSIFVSTVQTLISLVQLVLQVKVM
ncbi:hypothetical protein BDZ45DRAFT_150002 [Acephala macrosclerotiorum]|nr:hypothetical protein BDZ45DRAFT_150002 [Acephala macrosclerotiorum]